ncbi:MAG: rnhA operon protein [Haloarculaceae archaeon]
MTVEANDEPGEESDGEPGEGPEPDRSLPESVVEEAERLTRLARDAVDGNEAAAYRDRRRTLLDAHGYTARLRPGDHGEVLVLHPAEWVEDGAVRVELVEDVSRAVEVPLDGTGDPDEWEDVEAHNRTLAEEVEAEHGPVHGANAHAFADFMGNHYARPVERATERQVREFLEDYFPRNAWPTEAQHEAVEASLDLLFERVDRSRPGG